MRYVPKPQSGKEFKKKNDYSVSTYQGSKKGPSFPHVHKLSSLVKWLDQINIEWSVLNVYSRRSGDFLRRFYKDDMIPDRIPE